MLVTFGICFKQHFDTRYLVFYNTSPPRMFLSLDLPWEYRIQHGANVSSGGVRRRGERYCRQRGAQIFEDYSINKSLIILSVASICCWMHWALGCVQIFGRFTTILPKFGLKLAHMVANIAAILDSPSDRKATLSDQLNCEYVSVWSPGHWACFAVLHSSLYGWLPTSVPGP